MWGVAGDALFLGFAALCGLGFHLAGAHPVWAGAALGAAFLLLRTGQHWIAAPMEEELGDLRTTTRVLQENVDLQRDTIRFQRREMRQQRRLVVQLSSRLMEWCDGDLEDDGEDIPDPPN